MFSSFSKKSILLSVTVALSFGLVGCGSGSADSSSSTSSDTATSDTATPVKGPVYSATVKDANGQVALELKDTDGTLLPKYKFTTPPTYPVTVTGGWADQDYNGIMELDKGDILLKNPMKTFDITKPITPITTEATKDATTEEDFKKNLQKIATQYSDASGETISVADLEKTGTEAKPAVIALNVGMYPEISSNRKVDYQNLYNNVIANMNINANASSNANISVVKEIESHIFDNSNESKPEYTADDISFYKKLYKTPVYSDEKADVVAIYNNIGSDWEYMANNDYANAKAYRSTKTLHCTDFVGSDCSEETRANSNANVANIVFLQENQNASVATNANTSSPQNSGSSIAQALIGKIVSYENITNAKDYYKVIYNSDGTLSYTYHDPKGGSGLGKGFWGVDINNPNIIIYTFHGGNSEYVTFTNVAIGETVEDQSIPAPNSHDAPDTGIYTITAIN